MADYFCSGKDNETSLEDNNHLNCEDLGGIVTDGPGLGALLDDLANQAAQALRPSTTSLKGQINVGWEGNSKGIG